MSSIKAVGALVKYNMVSLEKETIDNFFGSVNTEGWMIEEVLEEWTKDKEHDGIIMFPIDEYNSQFILIAKQIPLRYTLDIDGVNHDFIFITEESKISISSLKNTEELSGEGKILTSFNMNFLDYHSKFLREKGNDFFKLEPEQIILNSVRLVVDDTDRTLGMKLTGKAAEIAAKKKATDAF